ncbi:MAG: dihydrolipoyl dehydrogenase [Campylobacterota bacterium]|nr:dihydrolipoyl dehydrogenase [Campylobacterota bacterium]
MKKYEVIIIGAGPAGYQAALELGRAGIKTLLVERSKERIGGTCLNVGCIPTKNYLESASFVSKIPYFRLCGVDLDFQGLDIKQLQEKTAALITEIRTGVLWMLEQSKVDILYGDAHFIDSKTVEVDDQTILFENSIIATGSVSRQLDQLPMDADSIISSSDVFALNTLPKSIAIIGVGAIGCEMATFFNAMGVAVTLIGHSPRLIPNEDADISKVLLRSFKKANIKVLLSTTITQVYIGDDGVELQLKESDDTIYSQLVLSATGRIPYSDGLGLENADVKQDERGFVEVSPSFRTSQEHIYAIGDCIDTPAFAHTAYAEAKIAAQNIINSQSKTNTHLTPSTIFTHPPIASCGLKESEAKEQEIDIEIKKAYFKVNAKAKILGDDAGFAKVIISAKSEVILGASIIGVESTEIIHELLLAIEKELTIREVREILHAHPTVSEIVTYL